MKIQYRLQRRSLALAIGALVTSSVVYGQSTTSSIYGQVPLQPGESIVIRNNAGLNRTVGVDKQGRYNATQLPVGTYSVTLMRDGQAIQTRDNVLLKVGVGAEISFADQSASTSASVDAKQLGAVQVTASQVPPIDVSSVDSRTVITADQLAKLPLGRSAEAIALLSPGAVAGAGGASSRTGEALVSFGGSSSTENAYYINGFNTTDPYNSAGGIQLPYGSIDQEQSYTGGYGAEYGRSDGGVINVIGKSGTNEWHFGGQMLYEPTSTRASQRNTYYENGLPSSPVAGYLYDPNHKDNHWTSVYDAYVGGPLIKDKLFFFGSAEMQHQGATTVANVGAQTDTHSKTKTPKWYAKINWNITDNNLLELTGASEKEEGAGSIYNYDYNNLHDTTFKGYANNTKTGGDMWSAKFTSYITDNLTFNAMYGKMKVVNYSVPANYNSDLVYVTGTTDENPALNGGVPITNNQTVSTISNPDKNYKTSNLRVSLTYVLGSHTITAGIDNLRSTANSQNSVTSGPGYYWSYGKTSDPTAPVQPVLGVGAPADYPNGSTGYYVTKNVSISGANLLTTQHAQFIQDEWQVSDRWKLRLGLRNDSFVNYNASGHAYMKQTSPQWSPRLGFSWDVNGDGTFQVYGNAGRFYLGLPLAPGGAANGYTSTQQYYTYSGIAADGSPTGLTAMSEPVSANNAFGQTPDPRTVTSKNIKAENQDEFILGFTKTAGPSWIYGAKFTRRLLRHVLDDYCDADRVVAKAASLGIDDANDATCYYINPGEANTFSVEDKNGVFHNVTLSNAELGFPHAIRRYYALEGFLEHPFDGHWYGKIDYTFSRSYGNTEGQGQSDIRATGGIQNEDWDFAQLMVYANGPQGNDHTHQIKAYGYYQITPEWLVSANLSLISGTPRYCLGYYGTDQTDPSGYHSNYHWCNGKPSAPGANGRLSWVKQLDLGVRYSPNFASHRLAFSLDVFNVTNSQAATNVGAQLDGSNAETANPLYGTPYYLQAPRYVRLGVTYDY